MPLRPQGAPATPVRVVYQGGGAKLVNLLAAYEKILALEADGDIKVTRVAGTSAGSIIAAMHALHIPPSVLKGALLADREYLKRKFRAPWAAVALAKLLCNRSVWPISEVRKFLEKVIPPTATFENTTLPLCIVASNLSHSAAVYYRKDPSNTRYILNAVIDSAAVPFGFRTWNHQDGDLVVDGGLCENLPVDAVGGEEADGKIIAIGFKKAVGPAPSNILKFAGALFDVAISHSEKRSRGLLPDGQICLLDTPIGTFEFPKALDIGLVPVKQGGVVVDVYGTMTGQVLTFFSDFIKATHTVPAKVVVELDTWRHTDAVARELMLGVGNVYFSQHSNRKINYVRAIYEAALHSLAGEGYDAIKVVVEVAPADEAVFCLAFAIDRPPGTVFQGSVEIRAKSLPSKAPRGVKVLPMLKEGDDYRRICVFFDPPLEPNSGTYQITLLDGAVDVMARLKKGEVDEMIMALPRARNELNIEMVLHVPRTMPVKFQTGTESHAGREMTNEEINKLDEEFRAPRNFVTKGWIGEKVPPGKRLKADVAKC